jgi:hypothetical protein
VLPSIGLSDIKKKKKSFCNKNLRIVEQVTKETKKEKKEKSTKRKIEKKEKK